MSGSKNIPIFNKTTGEISSGQSEGYTKPKKPEQFYSNSVSEYSDQKKDDGMVGSNPLINDSSESFSNLSEDPSKKNQKSKKSAKQEIRSLAKFIEYAYSRKGQRILGTFSKAEKAICQDYMISPAELDKLLVLAGKDTLLYVPKELLLVARSIVGYPRVKGEIKNFVERVFKMHFLFDDSELSLVLNNHPDAISPENALDKLAKAKLPSPEESTVESSYKNLDQQILRTNAAYCLAIWFVETRSFSIEKTTQMLNFALWKPSIPEPLDDTDRLKALTEIRDIQGVGLVYAILKKESDKHVALAETANRRQEVLAEQIKLLNQDIEELKLKQQESERKIFSLISELENEKNAHSHARVHMGDDKEQLRSRLLRRLKTETNLLEEGLHALRRDPPKIHVMDDHAERALEGLYKEIKELESED